MAVVDLEPAEHDKVDQREEVWVLHASHPPYFMIKENHLFNSIYWHTNLLQVMLWDYLRKIKIYYS